MPSRSRLSICETGSTSIRLRTALTPATFATRFSRSLDLNGCVTLPVSVTTPSSTSARMLSKMVKKAYPVTWRVMSL